MLARWLFDNFLKNLEDKQEGKMGLSQSLTFSQILGHRITLEIRQGLLPYVDELDGK